MITSPAPSQQLRREQGEQPGADVPLPAITRIAVPLDGSQLAERVLALAVALAKAFHAELVLVRAYGPPHGFPLGSASRSGTRSQGNAAMTTASLHLARLAMELRNCGVRVATRLLPLHADDAILDVTAHAAADVILLAVEPHIRWGHASSLGRVADRVVRHSPVPVLLITPLKGAQVLSAERIPARVLVPLDATMAGARALPYARAFAAAFHGSITLVRRSGMSVQSTCLISEAPEHEEAPPRLVETHLLRAETPEEFAAGMSSLAGDLVVWGRPEAATPEDDARWAHGATTLLYLGHRPVLMVP